MAKFCAILLLVSFSLLSAQEGKQTYGIFGTYNANLHISQFPKIPGVPNCCKEFTGGFGSGYSLGALFEHKIAPDWLLGARVEIDDYSALLQAFEGTTVILDNRNVAGEFEHHLESTINSYQLSIYAGYKLAGEFRVNGGFFVGQYTKTDYSQYEKISKPNASASFLDSLGNDTHLRIRNQFAGSLPDVNSTFFGGRIGVSMDFPLNKKNTLKIAPEINYDLFFNDIMKNVDWKVSSLKMGIALKYTPSQSSPKIENFKKEKIIDTVQIVNDRIAQNLFKMGKEIVSSFTGETETEIITTETMKRTDTMFLAKSYSLEGSITAVGVDPEGNEIRNPVFKVEEYVSNRLDPMLNYIFFEDNSAEIPKRYSKFGKDEADKFDVTSLFRENTLDIYYHILDIIGKRMREIPKANITLIGCNTNLGDEKGNLDLSRRRAESVRDYLVNTWSIDAGRIKIDKRGLPLKPSTPIEEADKTQENRRVEILCDNDKILEPVFIEKIDRSSNPPIIRFKPEATADAGLKTWKISSYQNSDKDNKFTANGEKYAPGNVDWDLGKFQKLTPKSPEPILYALELEDNKGIRKTIEGQTLPIDLITIQKKRIEKKGDFEIERYSLILFDFDKETIEGTNKKIVSFISSRIKPNSKIEIIGHTDRTGGADYNKNLSGRRAVATKNALKRQDATTSGKDNAEFLYNNDLPEGRFYCRTVEIIVESPIENK